MGVSKSNSVILFNRYSDILTIMYLKNISDFEYTDKLYYFLITRYEVTQIYHARKNDKCKPHERMTVLAIAPLVGRYSHCYYFKQMAYDTNNTSRMVTK
jgi:hypothetical protein